MTNLYGWICGQRTPLNGTELGHITLEGVGVALSYANRFNGSFGRLSVAAHSIAVSIQLPEHLRLAGLMHDVGEIVVGDIPAPLKSLVPKLMEMELEWRENLCTHLLGDLGLATHILCDHHMVRELDYGDYFRDVGLYEARGRRGVEGTTPELEAAAWAACVRTELRGAL